MRFYLYLLKIAAALLVKIKKAMMKRTVVKEKAKTKINDMKNHLYFLSDLSKMAQMTTYLNLKSQRHVHLS